MASLSGKSEVALQPGELLTRCRFTIHPLKILRRPPGFRDARELVSPDYTLWWILEGRGSLRVDGQNESIEKGDLCFFKPGTKVRGEVGASGCLLAHLHFMPVENHWFEALSFPRRAAGLADFFSSLIGELAAKEKSAQTAALFRQAFLWKVLAQILENGMLALDPAFGKGKGGRDLLLMTDHLSRNLRDKFSLAALARLSGLDRTSVIRRFKQGLGTTPALWFRRERLERGRGLLHAGLTVAETARRSGYPDPFTFSKAFKAQFKKSPSDYLKSRRDE